ncbi:unnamed protein product [Vicia faba]|uniref:Uncharacterized protein n=1 Tax=Vicia faba TaxID=3906 RepID=A0AAV0YYM1_VICFA|nr:unnamed protein product [Vicia faba]
MEFIKIVREAKLVDEKVAALLEPKNSSPAKDTQDKGGVMGGSEYEDPHLEDFVKVEEIWEESRWLGFSCIVSWPLLAIYCISFTSSEAFRN